MINRYSREEMSKIWSIENKYKKWLDVELAVCYAYNKKGIIPDKDYKIIVKKADFNIKRIEKIEHTVKHDVIAFLTSVSEYVGPSSRFIHLGMTSSDMIDTANALILKESSEHIIKQAKKLSKIILRKAKKYKYTPIIGRTHGVHAEPTSVGLKMLIWYDDLQRAIENFNNVKLNLSRGKISGAVGNYANISPTIEKIAMKKLKLQTAKISSQIISRDVYADYIYAIAKIGNIIEKIVLQIRLLQRTETREFEEPFAKGQKGSSAMPHKRNPVLCEQMTGLARILRSNVISAMENIALWDERDISHSSVERIILPDSSILIDYMLDKMCFIIDNMNVYIKNIKKNMKSSYNLFFSQKVLLSLVNKGLTREKAYKIVQEKAMEAWGKGIDFKKLILEDSTTKKYLNNNEIENIFNIKNYLEEIDKIFKRFI